MKAKKLLALLLTFVMVVSLLPVNALAVDDPRVDVKLVEETLAGRDGVAVELWLTGSTGVAGVSATVSYDANVFELVDADGNAIALTKRAERYFEAELGDYEKNYFDYDPDFPEDSFNRLVAVLADENTGTAGFLRASMSYSKFTSSTIIGKLFLAFKDGKDMDDVTAKSLRLATYEEAEKLGYGAVIELQSRSGDVQYLNADGKGTEGAEAYFSFAEDFEFAKEKPVCAAPAAVVSEYGEKLGSITLTNPAGNTAGTWTWDKPETVLDAVGTKTYTATFTPADSAAYQTVSGVEIEVSVVAKALEGVSVGEINDQGYTGEAIKPTVTVTDKTGLTLVEGTDYTVTYENNINVGVATVTVKAVEGGNYTFADVKGSFNIAAAASELKITSDISKTYDGVAVMAPDYEVVGSTQEAVVEYYSDAECTTKIDAPADAGTYYVKVSVAADDNYGAASASVSFTIKAADYTYTYAGSTASNVGKSYPETSAATAEGVDGESVKGTLSWYTNKQCTTAASGSFAKVGSTTLYWKFTPDAEETNYVATAKTGSVTFTVSTLPVQVFADGFAGTVEKTYGDEAFTRAATLTTGTGAITYKSSNEAVATVDGDGKVTVLAAGTTTITATAALVETEWAETPVSYTLTVAKKAVTVTVDAAERAYGEENPVFTAKAEGLAGADTLESLGLTLTTKATSTSKVGSYDVAGSTSNANYDVTIDGTGKLKITAKVLENVAAADIEDQVYTGEAITPAVTVKSGEIKLVEGTDFTAAYANNTNKGTAVITISPVEGSNYAFAAFEKTFEIVAAKSTVTVDASVLNKTYDGVAVLAPDYEVVGSTQEAVVEYYSDAECTTKIDAPADAGTYYVKVSVAADDNYGAASASVSFTIKAADYTYTYAGSTASNVGKSYPETSAATAEGVDGESVKGTLSWYTNKQCTTAASGSFTKVGSTTLYWKFTPDAEETNYVATAKTGSVTFTVSALPVQVFADGFAGTVEKTYGDEAFTRAAALTTGTGAITYKSSNEAVATVDGDGKVTILAAGTATITATAALVETEWAETPVSYTLTVAKKAVTVTVDAAERAYGEENPVFTAKAEGLVGADTVESLELGLKTSATAKSNVGTYDVVGDGSYNKNYDVTILGTGALTVKKAVWSGSIAEQQIRSKFAFTGEKAVDFPAGLPADKGTTTYTLGEVSDASAIFASAPVVDAATGKMTLNLAGKDAYVENMSAAVAVKVTMQNYEDVTVSFVVTLIDKEAVEASAKDITVTYTGEAVSDSKISGTATFEGKKVNGTWAFKAEQGLTNVADSGAKIVVFTPEDSVNYATAEVTINVTINKAKVTGSPAYTRINEKDKTLADAALGVGTLAPEGGTIRWKDKDGNTLDDTTVVTVNTGYTWEYTPVDTANYEIATGTLTPYSVSSGGGSTTKSEVKVEETDGGEVKVSTEKAAKGKTVTVEVEPDMGFKVVNVRVYDAKGNEITVTQNASGEYTFVMPEGKVRVEAEFAEETVELPFTDVDEDAWYYDSVAYVYEKGLMNGTAADKFSPAVSTTRGMIVTILYNLEGKPAAGTAAFEDVSADAWYAKSVAWAAENGIVTGYGDGKFGPEDTITREQFAAILFRYAKLKGYDVSVGENTNILSYTDALSISEYAIPAMQWACGAGLINGVTESTLAPTGSATRAQAAKILMMFCQNVAQ